MSERARTPKKGTALARPIDLTYPSNRLALAGGATVGVITGGVMLLSDGLALSRPFWTGVGAFLAWAIARELAPDHNLAAAIAIPLAGLVSIWVQPFVGLAVLSLLAARMWAGTVGHHPSAIDLAAGLIIAAYAGTNPGLWMAAAALGAGVVSAARHRMEATGAVTTGVAIAAVVAAVSDDRLTADVTAGEWAALAAVLIGLIVILPIRTVTSLTDRRELPISPRRITWAWVAAGAIAAYAAVVGALAEAGPLLAALAACGPVLMLRRLRRG